MGTSADLGRLLEAAKLYRTLTRWTSSSKRGIDAKFVVEAPYTDSAYKVLVRQLSGGPGYVWSFRLDYGPDLSKDEFRSGEAPTVDAAVSAAAGHLSAAAAAAISADETRTEEAQAFAELWGNIYETDLPEYERRGDPGWVLPESPAMDTGEWAATYPRTAKALMAQAKGATKIDAPAIREDAKESADCLYLHQRSMRQRTAIGASAAQGRRKAAPPSRLFRIQREGWRWVWLLRDLTDSYGFQAISASDDAMVLLRTHEQNSEARQYGFLMPCRSNSPPVYTDVPAKGVSELFVDAPAAGITLGASGAAEVAAGGLCTPEESKEADRQLAVAQARLGVERQLMEYLLNNWRYAASEGEAASTIARISKDVKLAERVLAEVSRKRPDLLVLPAPLRATSDESKRDLRGLIRRVMQSRQ